jgi:hypothetical protein
MTPRAIQGELALEAFFACWGAYLLLRRLVPGRAAAALGGFAYGLSGFFAGHSSHIGIFSAAAWFPWLLLAYRRAVDGASPRRDAALGALAGGLMILAGYPQTAIYGFCALGLYSLADLRIARRHGALRVFRILAIVAGMAAGAALLAAVQLLPTLELTLHSIRAVSTYGEHSDSALVARPLLSLVWPDALGVISDNYTGPFDITQYYFYAGVLLLPLAVLGALKGSARIGALVMTAAAAWYMVGPAGGLYRIGALVPLLHRVRAPIQGWFVVALGLAMLAAAGAAWLFARWRSPWLKVALLAFFFLDLFYWNSARNPLAYARGSFAQLYGAGEALAAQRVAAVQPPLTRFGAPAVVPAMGPLLHPLLLRLDATYGYVALLTLRYDQYTNAIARNSRLRDGINVARVLDRSTGALLPNPSALPRAYFPKAVSDVRSAQESLAALDTLDPSARSVVEAPHPEIRQDPSAQASVTAREEQAYRVQYRCASPSLLKLAETWFPGWHATLNGVELPIHVVDHALIGVVVPPGSGEIEFRFRPTWFAAGTAISLLTLAGLIALALIRVHPRSFAAQ